MGNNPIPIYNIYVDDKNIDGKKILWLLTNIM